MPTIVRPLALLVLAVLVVIPRRQLRVCGVDTAPSDNPLQGSYVMPCLYPALQPRHSMTMKLFILISMQIGR